MEIFNKVKTFFLFYGIHFFGLELKKRQANYRHILGHSLEMFPKLWIVLAGLNVDCGEYSDSGFGHCLKVLVLRDIDSKYTGKWAHV